MMKRLLAILICGGALFATTSCEKCSTCTTTSDDPATFGEPLSEEVCGRGRAYDDQIKIYEGTWDCQEN